MGTSQSSGGPGTGVPMVPPWVPNLPLPEPNNDGNDPPDADNGDDMPNSPSAPDSPVPTAPQGRFRSARRALGNFARTGDNSEMRRGVGHYIHSGYNGAGTASRRFGTTSTTAGFMFGALSGQVGVSGSRLDLQLLAGRSADEIMDAIIEAIRPVDGTQDAEAARAAIRVSLTDLLTRFPDANLIDLTEEQRSFAVERFVAVDVYHRFYLDVGKTIQDKATTATMGLSRLREVKNYITETVAAAFRRLRNAGRTITSGRISTVVQTALMETFQVFEGFIQ